jgi:hypothetical protein
MKQILRVWVGLLLLAVLVGCTGKPRSVVVTGKLTYKGNAVNGATMQLFPVAGKADKAVTTISVAQDGMFRSTDLPAGEYKVVVTGTAASSQVPEDLLKKMPPEKRAEMEGKLANMNTKATIPFPDKYKGAATTDLKCTITGQDQNLELELKD